MHGNNGNRSRAASARGFMTLFAVLAMALGLMAASAEAAPFAYVTDVGSGSTKVWVIDTATNPPTVVATIPVGADPNGVAVTPDGKRAYVTNYNFGTVSVIDTTTNMVVGPSIAVGHGPQGIAVTPDGAQVYVANNNSFLGPGVNAVAVIATASNMVVGGVLATAAQRPDSVAVTPDGKHVYVTNHDTGTVWVIRTADNMLETTIPVGSFPKGVTVNPDGKHAYVANEGSASVSVIRTADNTVETTVTVGVSPQGVAVTPDGTHVYVVNFGVVGDGTVSVIRTADNIVETTVTVGGGPHGIAFTPDGKQAYVANRVPSSVSVINTLTKAVTTIPLVSMLGGDAPQAVGTMPPPPSPVTVPFLAFSAKLKIAFSSAPNIDLNSSLTLSATASDGIKPLTEPVTLSVGPFTTTIPAGSFRTIGQGFFKFDGSIAGVSLDILIKPTGTLRYAFLAKATGASLTGTTNPVPVGVTIGDDRGTISVTATISP